MAAPYRSLADALRDLDRDQLTRLLADRSDLASPVPEGISALAARAATAGSATRALHSLTLPELQVVEALAVLGGTAPLSRIAAAVGLETPEELGEIPARLCSLALAWESADGLRLVRPLVERLAQATGLAAEQPEDTSSEQARERVASAPEALQPAFAALAWGPAHTEGGGPLAAALREAGIVVPDGDRLRIPRSVHLALRGGQVHRTLALTPPELAATPLTERFPGSRGAAAAEAAQRAVDVLDSMVRWPQDPPPVLRRGGLPQRDLRQLAAAVDAPIDAYAAVMQTAWAAGWITSSEVEFLPTRDPLTERQRPTEDRWVELAQHWLALPHVPSRVGEADDDGQPRALFSDALRRRGAAGRRRRALELLASVEGQQVEPRALHSALHWYFPLVSAEIVSQEVTALLHEGEALGVVADGALTRLGLALLSSPEEARTVLAGLLPPVVDEVMVAGDLTVTVPGRPSPRLAVLADWGAALSHGAALSVRIDARTLGAQIERGGDVDAFLELLEDASRTPLPQTLRAVADDARRRHGPLQVGRAACVMSADEEVLERLLAHPASQSLGLRRLAPTVAASTQGPQAVLAAARAAGLSPQEFALDGALPPRRRTRPVPPAETLDVSPSDAADLILRAESGAGASSVVGRLQDSIDAGEELRIGLVDGRGGMQVLRVVPLALKGGRLTARHAETGEEFTVPVHRVTLG